MRHVRHTGFSLVGAVAKPVDMVYLIGIELSASLAKDDVFVGCMLFFWSGVLLSSIEEAVGFDYGRG
jgi:hypothetical protein